MIPPVLTATAAELYCERTRRKLADITLGTNTTSILAAAIRRSCSGDVTTRPEALVLEIGRGLHRARIGPWLAVLRRLYAISFDRSAHLLMLALVEFARRDLADREKSLESAALSTSTSAPKATRGSPPARGSARETGRSRAARRNDDLGVSGDVTAEVLERVDAQIAAFAKHCAPLAALSATIGRIMSRGESWHRDVDRRRRTPVPAAADCLELAAALAAGDPEWDSGAFRPMWFTLGLSVPTDEASALATLARALFPSDPPPSSIDPASIGNATTATQLAWNAGSGTMSARSGARSNGASGQNAGRCFAADRANVDRREWQSNLEVLRLIRAWLDERMPSLRSIPAEDLELVLEGIGIQHVGRFSTPRPQSESDPPGVPRETESSPSPAQRFAQWHQHATTRILPVLRELSDHARHPLPLCDDAATAPTGTVVESCGDAQPRRDVQDRGSTGPAHTVARVRYLKALAVIARGRSGATHRANEIEAVGDALRCAFDGLTNAHGGVSPRHWRTLRDILHGIDAALDVRASRFDPHASPYHAGDSAVVPACVPPLLGPGAARAILKQSARLDGPLELARQRRNEARSVSRDGAGSAPLREDSGAADLPTDALDGLRVDPRMLHALRYLTGERDLAPPAGRPRDAMESRDALQQP